MIEDGRWVSVNEGLPPERRAVLVTTTESYLPSVGYTKDNGSGLWWVIPGVGGTVEWWCDAIPSPLPDPHKERAREAYERYCGDEMVSPDRARK